MAFLNINKKQNKEIVKKIDQDNYMRLGKPTSRLDLFNFAVALGYKHGASASGEGISNKESFVRDEYIGNERYMLASLFFVDYVLNKKADLEDLIDDSVTFPLAEKYAEEGFNILNDYMKSSGEKKLMYKLLGEMDTKFPEIIASLPKEHVGYEFDEEPTIKMVADDSTPSYNAGKASSTELDLSLEIRQLKKEFDLPGTALLYCYDNKIQTVQDLVDLYSKNSCLPKISSYANGTNDALVKILTKAGVEIMKDQS